MIGFDLVGNRVARRGIFHTTDGNDLTRARRFNVFTFVGVHQHKASDALFRIFNCVRDVGT